MAGAGADAAAVGVERDVRDQPGGQAEPFGGGGGGVQDVVVERGRAAVGVERQGPAERPDVPSALLGGGVRRALRGSADQQPAPLPSRRPDRRGRCVSGRPLCGAQQTVASDAHDRRRDLDQVRAARAAGPEHRRSPPPAARPGSTPGRSGRRTSVAYPSGGGGSSAPVGHTSRSTGSCPSRRASSAAGPDSSRTASAVAAAENATPPCAETTRGASDSASTAANPTPNRPTEPASSRFADARSAASAVTPAASSGAPVFATRSSPPSTVDPQPPAARRPRARRRPRSAPAPRTRCRRSRRAAGPPRRSRLPGSGWASRPRRRGRRPAVPRCRTGRRRASRPGAGGLQLDPVVVHQLGDRDRGHRLVHDVRVRAAAELHRHHLAVGRGE